MKRTWTDAQLVKAVKQHHCLTHVVKALGLQPSGKAAKRVQKRINELALDTSHFDVLPGRAALKDVCHIHGTSEFRWYQSGDKRRRRCLLCRRETDRRSRQSNLKAHAERSMDYRERNSDKVKAYVREYHKTHRVEHCNYQALRRAKKRSVTVELVDRRVVYARDLGLCGLCGLPVDENNWHLDHIVPLCRGGEHSYTNVQVAHPKCNLRKGGGKNFES